jgi:tripeptide aminopeptidase
MNIVPEKVCLTGEVRSRQEKLLKKYVQRIYKVCEKYCQRYKAKLVFKNERLYNGYRISQNSPIFQYLTQAYAHFGVKPQAFATGGGQDANIFNAGGVPTVNIGCGMKDPHTVKESLDLAEFKQAAALMLRLAAPQS